MRNRGWAQKYIKDQNDLNKASYPTLAPRLSSNTWTKLPNTSTGCFLLKNDIFKTYVVHMKDLPEAQVDKKLFFVTPKDKSIPIELSFASLNCTLTYLGMELFGRTNLGEGVLDVNVVDYNHIPIVDPAWLKVNLNKSELSRLVQISEKIMKSELEEIDMEVQRSDRKELDKLVLGGLNLGKKDLDSMYGSLVRLAQLRDERAKAIIHCHPESPH